MPVIENGEFNESVTSNYFEKDMYLSIVATDEWLRGLVSLEPYKGNIPAGFSFPNCWCGPTSPANPSGAGGCAYEEKRCPNGELSCTNCRFCCPLPSGLFYQLGGETGIDDPRLYYPGSTGLTKVQTQLPSDRNAPYYWYRIYEEIPSTYNVACPGLTYGATGAPIDFIGGENLGANDFRAVCFDDPEDTVPMQIIGKTSPVFCKDLPE